MATSLKTGDLFDGRYLIERLLGSGGMADVYLALDQELGRQVAIKILYERFLSDESFLERFRREAVAAATLSHPNIVRIYDRSESDDGLPYISMEVVHGRDLCALLAESGPLAPARAVAIMIQVLAALGAAHAAGIIHRDVKPQNVLIDSEDGIKVTDFGIARSATSQLTEDGSLVGTASYMSPEQAQGQTVGPASDLYSAGILLYELLTARVPFLAENGSAVEVALKHVNEPPPTPRQWNPSIPPALETVILRSLSKDPAQRYPTAAAFSDALAAAIRAPAAAAEQATVVIPAPQMLPPGAPPQPYPSTYVEGYVEETYPRPQRNPLALWLLAALILILGLLAAFLWSQNNNSSGAAATTSATTAATTTAPTTTGALAVALSPALVGMKEPVAVKTVDDNHLTPQVIHQPSEKPEGTVFKQDPAPGKQLHRGDVVTIYVVHGRPLVPVPDVSGQPFAVAEKALVKASFKVNRFGVYSNSVPTGQVVAQAPTGGAKAAKGSAVRVNVSKGPADAAVPDLSGQSEAAATQSLTKAGFKPELAQVPSAQPSGTVVAQSPAAGSTARRGSTVYVNVSKGRPQPTTTSSTTTTTGTTTTTASQPTVPDVSGETQSQAASDLRAAGFNVWVNKQTTTDQSQDGIVLSQNPTANSQAKRGSTVYLTVGQYQGP